MVVTTSKAAVAAAYRVDAARWSELFSELMDPIETRFARPESRRRVRDFLTGLLAPLPTKNCWTIAEHAGDDSPGGMQDLISRASWDDTLVRVDVRDFITRRLGHPDAILVIDETGDLKKGRHTVGVQRQYSGTAGKIENCQLAVHLSYASPHGHTLVDVALYLPKSWTDDPQRRIGAGIPDSVRFATKPQLARRLIETAVAGGLPCSWVTGDEAYGGDPTLATALRGHRLGYVLAVACSHRMPTGLGIQRADQIAASLPKQAWQRISAGTGAKGFRYYDWAFITLPHATDQHEGHHWLLIRRNRSTSELAFYRCWSPELVALRHLVTVAGRRWSIEESFQATKTELGLDQHQHRRWTAWHRWTTLVIAAHAFLAAAATLSTANFEGLIPITVNELRRLFYALIIRPAERITTVITWSIFRRRHQDAAMTSHYARQALTEP
jgi:SRSO17 transposase